MDIVKIVFFSAVVFPVIAALAVMLFVRNVMGKLKKKKHDFERKEIEYKENEEMHKQVISSLEDVVDKQDSILDEYRDL